MYLDFSFSEIAVRSAFHRFTFFAHTLALQVFKLGVWDENLVLHPKLNANGDQILYITVSDAWEKPKKYE